MALWSRFFTYTAGSAASRAAGSVVGPVFDVSSQNSAARRPYATLDPGMAAEALARDLDEAHEFTSLDGAGNVVQRSTNAPSGVDFPDDAIRASVGPARFEVLRQLARQVPPLAETLDLWRRGRINEETVNAVLSKMAVPRGLRPALKSLRWVLPSVTDMVRFGVREVYNPPLRAALDLDAEFPQAFADDASKIGLDRETAGNYWAAHWELPSFTEGAQMLFRGEITRGQFQDLLKALDYAPTWRPKLEAIARAIPTMSDFIRFAVREVYSPKIRDTFNLDEDYPAVFTEKAALHGMNEEDAKAFWAAHWQLPSTEQGFRMFHRDVIDLPTLRLLLRAKDVMPFWRQRLIDIAYLTPGRIDLRRMYAAGVIDRARVKRGYLDLGYKPADAEILTDFAVKLAEEAPGSARRVYLEKARQQLWTRTHTSYLAGQIDRLAAAQKLVQAGVPTDQNDAVLDLWDHEREVYRKQLTPAQLKRAYVKAIANPATGQPWTRDEVIAELVDRGYSLADANTYLDQALQA
jgi:hypothetical protein